VVRAWVHFFVFLITPLQAENFVDSGARSLVESIDWVQRWVFRLVYLAFLLVALPLLYVALHVRRGRDPLLNTGALMTLLILVTSVLQALLQYGGNGRFSLPTQTLAVAAVIVCAIALRNGPAEGRIR
jgi:uncharacterized membrane protein YhaH (DUF805 family)